ncbi:MAG: hypothetical protein JWQ30_2169 [Sediminibacterium sp.]|nr:hypothetical protein [Sediminibacterium sp.]
MNTRNIISWSYIISIASFGLTIYAKIAHSESTMTLFVLALLTQLVFAVFAIYELRGSEHFTRREKADWTVLIVCAPLIFGTYYLLRLRHRILPT